MNKLRINPDGLKIYALLAMTVDHIATYLSLPGAGWYRMFIGRTAFPIFAFLLMYHLAQKHIYEKYTNRLLFFGIVTMLVLFPFESEHRLNILFTFLFPVLTAWGFDQIRREKMNRYIGLIFGGVVVLFMSVFSAFANYSVAGYAYLMFFYAYFTGNKYAWVVPLLTAGFLINIHDHIGFGIVSLLTTLFLLTVDMSAKYPRLIKKWWVFYAYFPLHLLVILSVRYLVG